jgi:outer membrane protein assembly factor BamE (lipoprotein component of BamABCDE complex)
MKRTLSTAVAVAVMLTVACGKTTYNAPFIDTVETLQLEVGMTPEEITEMCGDPLYVAYGDGDRLIWAYEVRSRDVGGTEDESVADAAAGAVRTSWGIQGDETSGLIKRGNQFDHGEVQPVLYMLFIDGELAQWRSADIGSFWEWWHECGYSEASDS